MPHKYTNPDAVAWWQGLLESYTSIGIEGYKLDYAEEIGIVDAGMTAGWALNDLTFEARRVAAWQAMVVRTRKLWAEPYVSESPAQRLGHTGVATMPLAMALTAVGWQSGSAPAPIAVVYAGTGAEAGPAGGQGLCGAALLAAP